MKLNRKLSKEEFDLELLDYIIKNDLSVGYYFVVMKYAMPYEDILKEEWNLEMFSLIDCYPSFIDLDFCVEWDNDWFEGQNQIIVFGIYSYEEVKDIILDTKFHLM